MLAFINNLLKESRLGNSFLGVWNHRTFLERAMTGLEIVKEDETFEQPSYLRKCLGDVRFYSSLTDIQPMSNFFITHTVQPAHCKDSAPLIGHLACHAIDKFL